VPFNDFDRTGEYDPGRVDSSGETFDIPRWRYAVLLTGNFNPAIFHPDWLERHSVIDHPDSVDRELEGRVDENEESYEDETLVITSAVSVINTPSLTLQITPDRLLLRSRTSSLAPSELSIRSAAALAALPHTPILRAELLAEHHTDRETLSWAMVVDRLIDPGAAGAVLGGGAGTSVTYEASDESDGSWRRVLVESSERRVGGVYLRAHAGIRIAESPLGTARIAKGFIERNGNDADNLARRALQAIHNLSAA